MFYEECLTRQGEWSCQNKSLFEILQQTIETFSISYLNLRLKIKTATENEIKSGRVVIPFTFTFSLYLLFVNWHTGSVPPHTLPGSHISFRRKV